MSDTEIKSVEQDVQHVSEKLRTMTSLMEELTDVRKALKVGTELLRNEWPEFVAVGKKSLEETRLWKMAQIRELRDAVDKLKEVQRVVHSAEFVAAASHLKEFVETLERFQKLNESGLLDKVLTAVGYERKH